MCWIHRETNRILISFVDLEFLFGTYLMLTGFDQKFNIRQVLRITKKEDGHNVRAVVKSSHE